MRFKNEIKMFFIGTFFYISSLLIMGYIVFVFIVADELYSIYKHNVNFNLFDNDLFIYALISAPVFYVVYRFRNYLHNKYLK